MYISRIGMAVVALLIAAPALMAAEINGHVTLAGNPTANVVVSIEDLRQGPITHRSVAVIDHKNLTFAPHVVVVQTGSSVRFQNSDGMPCRIYSTSPVGTFVLRRQDGKPVTLTFDRPGVIEVHCADHNQIYAYVVVKDNSFFALTATKGKYKLQNVPPGHYTLQAWYEGKVIDSKVIQVGRSPVIVDFQTPRIKPAPVTQEMPDSSSANGQAHAIWAADESITRTLERLRRNQE